MASPDDARGRWDPAETADAPAYRPPPMPLERIELPVYQPRPPRRWVPWLIFLVTALLAAVIVWLVLR